MKAATHFNDVNKDSVILLYAIIKGKSIDGGILIHQSIRCYSRASTTNGFRQYSLVTALCKEVGVTW